MQPDGNNRILVAQPGFDVTTATEDQLLFNSDQNVFKIVTTINLTTPAVNVVAPGAGLFANGIATNSVAHGLTHTPAYIAFLDYGGNSPQILPWSDYGGAGTTGQWVTYNAYVDDTNVYVATRHLITGGSSITDPGGINVKVYILQESAN